MHLETAEVYSVQIISSRKALFTLDLTKNPTLRNEVLVHQDMAMYLLRFPRAEAYSLEYYGDWLLIYVTGKINNIY